MFVVCLLRVMRGALRAWWNILRVLAHSASTTPSEPGVMPAGVLPLCLGLFLLLLCACVLQSPVPIRVRRMCLLQVLLLCAMCLLQVTLCVLRLCVLGARVWVVFLFLARGGTLCAVYQWVLGVQLCVFVPVLLLLLLVMLLVC